MSVMVSKYVLRRGGAGLRNYCADVIPIGPGPAPDRNIPIMDQSQDPRPSLPWSMGGCHVVDLAMPGVDLAMPVRVWARDCQNPQCFAVQGSTSWVVPSHHPWVHPSPPSAPLHRPQSSCTPRSTLSRFCQNGE